MTLFLKKHWLESFVFTYLIISGVFIAMDFLWVLIFPLVIAIFYFAFFALDKLYLLIVMSTPLSINLENMDIGGIGIYLPTEPLLLGIMLLFLYKVLIDGKFDRETLKHPVTIAILVNLIWILITSITSVKPLVSFKFLLARLWFVISIYFVGTELFKTKSNREKFIWAYLIPLSVVIAITVVKHARVGFDGKLAHWVMNPFYKDHTSYGAILAIYFPLILYLIHRYKRNNIVLLSLCVLFFILTTGTIFSYTRAAWLSLIVAFGVALIYWLRVGIKPMLLLFSGAFIFLMFIWPTLIMKLEKNRQDSSKDFSEHIKSISNISSDASNLERINRWECAFKMFQERPFFGHGPGTYAFLYAPYQLSGSKTIISTNFGDLGNAHSEYIGPLAESGLLGSLTFIAIVFFTFYRGSKLYHRLENGDTKFLLLACLCALVTYFTHGVLNNYLDTDKASIPIWGLIAIIVAMDVEYRKNHLNLQASKAISST